MAVRVAILASPLEPDHRLGAAGGACGAVVEFQGIVRGIENGEPISAIDYECHVPMAEAQLDRIAGDVATSFGLAEMVVLHRIGIVPVGEASLYVRAEAAHRHEALAAVGEFIESLKRDVPIWKRPVARGG